MENQFDSKQNPSGSQQPLQKACGPLRGTYRIRHWSHWDREIDEAVADFRQRSSLLPNILIAAEQTHRRFDIAANANRNKIRNGDGRTAPPEEEFVSPSAFRGADYELEFCIDDSLPQDHFLLVHDPDPEGGLPLPDSDNLPSRRDQSEV